MPKAGTAIRRSRGRQARVFDRADYQVLKTANFHPLVEMIDAAKSLKREGDLVGFANVADKLARYFYPHAQHKQEVDVNVNHEFIINLAEAHGNPITAIEAASTGNVEGDEEV